MLTIETKELEISKELKRKVEMICKFACVKPTIANGNIKNIKGTGFMWFYIVFIIALLSFVCFNVYYKSFVAKGNL